MAQLPVELQQTLEDRHRPYYRLGVTTREMQRVLQQILHCPYEGLLKRMYLYGKAWELMTLVFEQFRSEQNLNLGLLKSREIEQIHRKLPGGSILLEWRGFAVSGSSERFG